jgi:hypothetical protein
MMLQHLFIDLISFFTVPGMVYALTRLTYRTLLF